MLWAYVQSVPKAVVIHTLRYSPRSHSAERLYRSGKTMVGAQAQSQKVGVPFGQMLVCEYILRALRAVR
jgi:hypothetical protein